MQKFNKLSFVAEMVRLSPRQGKNALKASRYIQKTLRWHGVSFVVEKFKIKIPNISAKLLVDGKIVPCEGCSFAGGEIKDKSSIVSSLIPSRFLLDYPNINFNPNSEAISQANFYFSPAVAVSRQSVPSIVEAKKVYAKIRVNNFIGESGHILVGNMSNPKKIIFGHYDSIGPGATDNASGIAVMMDVLINDKTLLGENLFVFDGNEELSYDYPTYWGHGYRVFEKKYGRIMEKAKKILVVDCVGNGETKLINNPDVINLAFPVLSAEKMKKKIIIISGDIEKLMKVYHSGLDTEKELSLKYLKEASSLLKSNLA